MLEWRHEMNTLISIQDICATIAITSVFKLVWILLTVLSICSYMVQEVMN